MAEENYDKFISLDSLKARERFEEMMEELGPHQQMLGQNGILSLITQALGPHDEVQGRVRPDGSHQFYIRNGMRQSDRNFHWWSGGSGPEGQLVTFDIYDGSLRIHRLMETLRLLDASLP